ncbi:MAG: DUF6320 domain-containing protein [Oscillospiraceae bacterium]|nr:DUF6320 domain-containing protein [Oscillospiraceae bacterium]
MKQCPYCHIEVGGDGQYCPLCQGPLVGEGEPARYPAVEPPMRRASLVVKLIAFFLLAGTAVSASVDFLLLQTPHYHWSVLVLAGSAAVLALLHALLHGRKNAPRLIFQILVGASLLALFCDWTFGWTGAAIDYVVPILCCAALILNFIFAFVRSGVTENAMVYLLLNMIVGVVPYIVLFFKQNTEPSVAWWLCMVISVVTFLGLVIFKGRTLMTEFHKRLHL